MAGRAAGGARAAPKPASGRGKGLEKFLASLEPKQIEALRKEADRRRPDLKTRPDVSALIREAVQEWLDRRRSA